MGRENTEGRRSIGLITKLKSYRLHEDGVDTRDASIQPEFPADWREYRAAADLFDDLCLSSIRVRAINPDKIARLTAHGVPVGEQVPLVVGIGRVNEHHLGTKREHMGHLVPETDSPGSQTRKEQEL